MEVLDLKPFDVGSIVQTARLLKADQRASQDDVLRQQYVQGQIAGQQQEQSQGATNFQNQQQEIAAKRQYFTAQAALASPDPKGTIQAIAPQFVQDFEAHHGQGSWAQLTPDQAHQAAQGVMQQALSVIGPQTKIKWIDQGGQQIAVDEVTGQPVANVKPLAKTASPDAQLSSATSTSNLRYTQAQENARAAESRKVTMRGQDLSGADKGIPAGYERDPNTPGALRPMIGGPHDPNATSAGMDSRSSVMFNRVASSANEAVTALKNIAELPVTTSTGWLGGVSPPTTLMGSVKSVLGQKVTSQEAQDYKTMIAGVSRSLSTIETAGLAPNGSITHSMDSITLNEGDSQLTKLRKLAETRQIIEKGIEPNLSNPKLAPAQRDLVNRIIGDVQAAIPFTQHDITKFQQSKNPNATLMDFAKTTGLPTQQSAAGPTAPPPAIQALLDKYK